tara:strand:- start:136 stop:966 length:831 start_codon:yes stop_codon:yes gene_type:complete
MNLTELRTFLAIIETGSLVRASEAMNVTQSTVTARLKALEDELGQRLIIRQKSGASLTAAGVRLQRYAATISDLWQQARQETALPDGMQSVCNMACHPDLWPDLGARLFDHIRTTQPHIALSIWTGGQHDLTHWLDNGLVDLALTYWPSTRAAKLTDELSPDRLILVSDKADNPIRFDKGYVYVEGGDDFGRAHATVFADAGTARLNFGTARLGLDHLLKNGGSAYLPDRLVQPHLGNDLHKLKDAPVFTRPSYVVSRSTVRAGWPWFDDAIAAMT